MTSLVSDAIVALSLLGARGEAEVRSLLSMWSRGAALTEQDVDQVVAAVALGCLSCASEPLPCPRHTRPTVPVD